MTDSFPIKSPWYEEIEGPPFQYDEVRPLYDINETLAHFPRTVTAISAPDDVFLRFASFAIGENPNYTRSIDQSEDSAAPWAEMMERLGITLGAAVLITRAEAHLWALPHLYKPYKDTVLRDWARVYPEMVDEPRLINWMWRGFKDLDLARQYINNGVDIELALSLQTE